MSESPSLFQFRRLLTGEITAKEYSDFVRNRNVVLLGGSGNSETCSPSSPGGRDRRSPSATRPASRYWLWPLCYVVGHKPDWIPAWIPNPYGKESWQWGCLRCHDPLKFPPEVKEQS